MKRWLMVFIPLAALGAFYGWRLRGRQADAAAQAKPQATQPKTPEVSVAPPAVRDVVETFEAIGSVESPFNVRIAPNVAGRIDFLQVREGDRVTAGQVLVRIDPSQIEAQVGHERAMLAE